MTIALVLTLSFDPTPSADPLQIQLYIAGAEWTESEGITSEGNVELDSGATLTLTIGTAGPDLSVDWTAGPVLVSG